MQETLQRGRLEDNIYYLPDEQMDRKEYLKCAKHLKFLGGKWNTKQKGFLFDREVTFSEITGYEENKIKKIQFFPTPDAVADNLVSYLGLKNHHKILEPSAGRGALVAAIHRVVPDVRVDAIEIDETNVKYLNDYSGNIRISNMDFLQKLPDLPLYDRIVANPPFTKNQDIDHIKAMYEVLKEGGELAALSSTSWQRGSQKKQVAFQEWIEELQQAGKCEIEVIPAGAFKESGTMIETVLLWIKK